jgi:hypothetical protein
VGEARSGRWRLSCSTLVLLLTAQTDLLNPEFGDRRACVVGVAQHGEIGDLTAKRAVTGTAGSDSVWYMSKFNTSWR